MVNYGNIITPQVMIISGLLSTLVSGFIIFNSIYVKRYIDSSSLASMGWLSIIIGVYKNNSNIFFYNLPLSTIIWAFWVIYGVNTLLIVIMLENCYPLFLSSYKGEIEFNLKGKLMSQPRTWLKRLGVVAIFSQMGLPPLIFFYKILYNGCYVGIFPPYHSYFNGR